MIERKRRRGGRIGKKIEWGEERGKGMEEEEQKKRRV